MNAIRTSVPVRYLRKEGGRLTNRAAIIWVDIPSLDPEDAPVVVTWDNTLRIGDSRQCQFRRHDGSLWTRSKEYNTFKPVSLHDVAGDGLAEEPGKWASIMKGHGPGYPMRGWEHPFAPPLIGGPLGSWEDIEIDQSPPDDEMFIEREAATHRNAERFLAVDGYLWERTVGPMFGRQAFMPRADTCHLSYVHPNGLLQFQRIRMFGFGERDLAIELTRTHLGREPTVDEGLTILDTEGYPASTTPMAVEAAAWEVIWDTRNMDPTSQDRRLTNAVVDLRDVLARRWPDRALNFNPKQHSHIWQQHKHQTVFPDPSDLVDLLKTVVSVAPPNWRDLTRDLRIVIDRASHYAMHTSENADLDALPAM